MPDTIHLAIIDRHQLFREGVKLILESQETFQIVIENDCVQMMDEVISQSNIDVLLIEVDLLKQYQNKIQQMIEDNDIKVIVVANPKEEVYVPEAIKLGVHGFVLKEIDTNSFIEAIHLVLEGKNYIQPHVTGHLVKEYRQLVNLNSNKVAHRIGMYLPRLYSKREGEILQLLAVGKSNRQIAETLDISEKTVKNHVNNLFKKLQVADRTQAAVKAIKKGWVKL